MIRYESHWFTPEMCRAEPRALYVFGDNLARRGKGGQAVIRHEPNAVGIPTKRAPSREPGAYFTDADFDEFLIESGPPFVRLRMHLASGGVVVWPADGIGTGRAELPQRAPRIWRALEHARLKLEGIVSADFTLAEQEKGRG